MKTINILPSINNIAISGRIISVDRSESGKRLAFAVIHNFGGDKEPSIMNFTMFNRKGEYPECLRKGNAVVVNAAIRSNNYEKDGKKVYRTEYVVKNVSEVPSANDISFAGRLTGDPELSASGNRRTLRVIRNMGGDSEPVVLTFIEFKKKDKEFPELKKGTPVEVSAYVSSNNYTNGEGEKVIRNEFVVKTVKIAELVARQVEDKVTEEEAEAAEAAAAETAE